MYEKILRLLISAVVLLMVACSGDADNTSGKLADPNDLTDPTDPNPTKWITRARGTSSEFYDVAYSGTRYVAVGDSARAISDDGVHWSLRTGSGKAITWGNDLFVLVGRNGVIRTSPDGTTWTTRQSDCGWFCLDDFTDIAWSGTLFVAVGENGMVYTSDDGVAWAERDTGASYTLRSVATSGSRFVIAGSWDKARYSDDGITWHENNTKTSLNYVMWDGTRFIGNSGINSIFTSDDGESWTYLGYGASNIVWDGSTYLGTSIGLISKSTDLKTWTGVFGHQNSFFHRILPVSTTGEYVAIGGDINSGLIVTSNDRETWRVRLTSREFVSVVWDGDRFMSVDKYGMLSISSDGVEWNSTHAIPYAGSSYSPDLVWSDSLKRYVVAYGNILWSDDGINWTLGQSALGASSSFRVARWTGDQFVAIHQSSVYTSADGETWEHKGNPDTQEIIRDIAWSSSLNLFVAVSYGDVFTSKDGTDWTRHTLAQYTALNGVTWAGNQFVIVGGSGKIFTSPDGANWTLRDSGTSSTLNAVSYDAGELLAVNSAGQVLHSTDGIYWTKQTTPSGIGRLNAIAKSPTRAVAVGERGTIISRP